MKMKKINSNWFGPKILWAAFLLLLLAFILYGVFYLTDWEPFCLMAKITLAFSAFIGFALLVILMIEHAQDKRVMISVDELPGTRKQSFPMFFGGAEIWFSHLDGMYGFTDEVIQKFLKDVPRIAKPSAPSLVAIILDETIMTASLIAILTDKLIEIAAFVQKVAFIGLTPASRRKVKQAFRTKMPSAAFAIHFTNDLEAAKEWLVGQD